MIDDAGASLAKAGCQKSTWRSTESLLLLLDNADRYDNDLLAEVARDILKGLAHLPCVH